MATPFEDFVNSELPNRQVTLKGSFDPSAGAGVIGLLGTYFLKTDVVPHVRYEKTGLQDVDWSVVGTGSGGSITVTEEDGLPIIVSVTTLKFPPGTVTDNGAGEVSIDLGAAAGHTIEDEGNPLVSQPTLNFVGDKVTVTNDVGNNATLVTIETTTDASELISGSLADARVPVTNITQHVAAIDHNLLLNYALEQHRTINDAGSTTTDLLSASKILSLLSAISSGQDSLAFIDTSSEDMGNITLSGEQTLNGILTSSSRVLTLEQTDGTENGIYVTGAGAWTRAADFDTDEEITNGATTYIDNPNSTKYRSKYLLVTPNPILVDVTSQSWEVLPALEFGSIAGTATEGNDTRLPTQDENDALAGTNGTPATANPFVTDSDTRNTDSRTPTGNAAGDLAGTFPNPTIGVNKVTYSKIQKAASNNVFIGNDNGAAQDLQELTASEARVILNVEDASTADQSDLEIETAYNNQVGAVSQVVAEAGTDTTITRWTAQRVAQAIAALAPGGDFSNGGDTTGAARTIGNNDLYGLGIETNGLVRIDILDSGEVGIGAAGVVGQALTTPNIYTDTIVNAVKTIFSGTAATEVDSIQILQLLGEIIFKGTTGGLLSIIDDKDGQLWGAADVSGNPWGYIDADGLIQFGNPFNTGGKPLELIYDAATGKTDIILNSESINLKTSKLITTGLIEADDDVDAAAQGVLVGEFYITAGGGAAPLNTTGLLKERSV